MGPAHACLRNPPRGMSLHVGIGIRVQVEPAGVVPVDTRTAGISVRLFTSMPQPHWIYVLSPTKANGVDWKQVSVASEVMSFLRAETLQRRY